MARRFNPPPGWPPVPDGWTPPHGWKPDPSWPKPPKGWKLWVKDTRKPWPARHWVLTPTIALVAGIGLGNMNGMIASTTYLAQPAATPTVTVTAPPITVSAPPVTVTPEPAVITLTPETIVVTETAQPPASTQANTQPQPFVNAPQESNTTDPRFKTCKEAKANGYGHYRKGVDPEYNWYRDADKDGVVCE